MLGMTLYGRNPWSIFDELESLQHDFNRLFSEGPAAPGRTRGGFPPINVWSSDDGIVLDIELPGTEPGDVDIQVVGDELTIAGTTRTDDPGEGTTFHRRERQSGEFKRTLQLPFRAESGKVKAGYKSGILRVNVPRAEAEKPRKIAIEAA